MPDVGTQAAGFGFNLGIGFNEIMMIATVATFLLAVTPGLSSNNPMAIPGDTVKAFDSLWFDGFNFFSNETMNGTRATCLGTLNLVKNYRIEEQAVPTSNASVIDLGVTKISTSPTIWSFDTFVKLFTSPGQNWLTKMSTDILYGLWGFINFIVGIIAFSWGILFGCGAGAIRIAIGVSIVSYWFFKMIPLFQFLWFIAMG